MTPRVQFVHPILAALPGTTAAVATAAGMDITYVGRWLRKAALRGTVQRVGGRTCGRGNATTWSRG